ncbi:MAG: superoxide dismutase [candidate division Zixibacteria bacterium]|jgi:hypothetical protein|nr:superoxide dismutase [candidate division Zixibacteria bacterium]
MKFLALEIELPGIDENAYEPHLKDEARRVHQLYLDGILREIYFRGDKPLAVIVLECDSLDLARRAIDSLPLVQKGLIQFEVAPLQPYPGWGRLIES